MVGDVGGGVGEEELLGEEVGPGEDGLSRSISISVGTIHSESQGGISKPVWPGKELAARRGDHGVGGRDGRGLMLLVVLPRRVHDRNGWIRRKLSKLGFGKRTVKVTHEDGSKQ